MTPGKSLAIVDRFAAGVGVDPQTFMQTIKATVLKTKDRPATDEEAVVFLAIAEKYGLSPWTKEIHAFVDTKSGAIVPIVGIDGWNHIANDHEQFAGEVLEIAPREEWVHIDDDAKLAPPWMKLTVYRRDRDYPTEHTEYLDECYVPARSGKGQNGSYKIKGHWQTHTKRALEHKTRIQARRIAFGFSGIYDEDEAQRIIAAQSADVEVARDEADTGEIIGPEDYQALRAEMERTGLSDVAVAKNLEHKANYTGPLEDMPVRVYEPLMAGLRSMKSKHPQPASEPAEEPNVAPETPPAADVEPQGDAEPQDAAQAPESADCEPSVSQGQLRQLGIVWRKLADIGYSEEELRDLLHQHTGLRSRKVLTFEQAHIAITRFTAELEKHEGEAA